MAFTVRQNLLPFNLWVQGDKKMTVIQNSSGLWMPSDYYKYVENTMIKCH